MPNVVRNVIRKANNSRFEGQEIHLRQGEMDGACGPYCLAMVLIGLELVEKSVLVECLYDDNSDVARLIGTLERKKGKYFFRNGTERDDLKKAMQASFRRYVEIDYLKDDDLPGRKFRDFANSFILNPASVRPVILGIDFGKSTPLGHWVLIVGHESYDNNRSHYLVLDPGASSPKRGKCWNATLENKGTGGPLPYVMSPDQGRPYRIGINDALGFIPK